MRFRNTAAVIISLALLLPAEALAASAGEQVQDLERVEVTGSRLAEEITDVPTPAYVVTRDEIEQSGARNVQEALARVPGVTGFYGSSSMAIDKGITVRGLSTEVLLLVDGIPCMSSNYMGLAMGSPFDLRTIPVGSVERIEVVKGASSAIYGSNAAGGVINIITRKGTQKSSGSIKAEFGGGGWFSGSVRGTAVMSGDMKVTLGYTRTQETGDIKLRLVDPKTSQYEYAHDYRGNDYIFSFEKGPWTFSAVTGNYDSEWEYFGDNRQENKYSRLSLTYMDEVSTGHVYYNNNKKVVFDASGKTNFKDGTIGLIFNRKQTIGDVPFVWGIDAKHENAENTGEAGIIRPYDITRKGFAPYLEASVKAGEANLDLGLRYEYWNVDNGDNVSEVVPRLSLNWQSANGQIWYATAGRFFAMPSIYQISGADAMYLVPNPHLKPESGWTYDIGVKNAEAKHPWNLGIFYMNMNDKIDYTFINEAKGHFFNVDEYRAWGVEGQVRFKFSELWGYTQSLTWTNAEEKKAGADWGRSRDPRWTLSGILNYHNGPWTGELAMFYYGDRFIPENSAGISYDDQNIFTVNASVAWKQGSHTLRLSCINIFNKEYVTDNSGFLLPERRVMASWEYEF